MANTSNKKMSFSIENLAKSSRTDESQVRDFYGTYIVNRNPWQDTNLTNFGSFNPSVFSSPYYTNHGQSSPCVSQFKSPLGNLRDSFKLIPDDGYSSQNSTPSSSKSSRKRSLNLDGDEQKSGSPGVGSALKRKRTDEYVDKSRTTRILQRENDSFIDSSLESSCGTSDIDEGLGDTPRHKKARTAFSDDQVQALEVRYKSQKYLPAGERSKLATELGLTDQQVKTWFQNRRMKEKRKHKDDTFGMPLPTGGVDVSQLQALGIPCPPPYTINNKHQQMLRDDNIPNFPSPTSSPHSPMFRTQPLPLHSRFQPIANGLSNSPVFSCSTNQREGYS
ncbi:homeobox protein Dlx3b-like [Argopecten irradians]|uniref:homeobox protein Dlx3b-like n=1 Tax=Argopecten irradians TaxID=31199 RepID=UPI00371615B8